MHKNKSVFVTLKCDFSIKRNHFKANWTSISCICCNYLLHIVQINTGARAQKFFVCLFFFISQHQWMYIWKAQKQCFFHLWLAAIPPNDWHVLLNFIMYYLYYSTKGSMSVYADVPTNACLFVKRRNICLLQCSNSGRENPPRLYWLHACPCQCHSWHINGIHTFI